MFASRDYLWLVNYKYIFLTISHLNFYLCILPYLKLSSDRDLFIVIRTQIKFCKFVNYEALCRQMSRCSLLFPAQVPGGFADQCAFAHVFVYTCCHDARSKRGTEFSEPQPSTSLALREGCCRACDDLSLRASILLRQRHWYSGTSSRPKAAHLWPSKRQRIKGWIHV